MPLRAGDKTVNAISGRFVLFGSLFVPNTLQDSGNPFDVVEKQGSSYVDVSTITWVVPRPAFYDYLAALVTAGLGKRIMFGSDQMRWPEKIAEGIDAIKQAPFLTEEQKRDFFYNNAARFLRLGGSEAVKETSLR